MTGQDHYKTLGIPQKATEDDVKKAYHQLAKQYHPDKNKAANAEEKFKEIGAAYEVLKDPQKRRVYDMQKEGDEERARAKKHQTTGSKTTGNGGTTYWSFGSNTKPTNGSTYSEYTRTNPGFNFRFTSFDDDEFFKRAKREFQNMGKASGAKTGNSEGKSQQSKKKKESKATGSQRKTFTGSFGRPNWDENWNEEMFGGKSGRKEHKNPFAFGAFHFMEDPLADFDDMFDDFMRDAFFTPRMFDSHDFFTFGEPPKSHTKPKPKQNGNHSTFASSREDSGLDDSMNENDFFERASSRSRPRKKQSDPMDDMWNWSKPMFKKRNKDVDSDYDFLSDTDEDEPVEMLFMSCSYCKRKINAANLSKHEAVCRRFNSPTKTPRSEPDENSNPEDFSFKSSSGKDQDWRKQHEDLMNSSRSAKRGSRVNREPRSESTPPPPKTPYLIECRWCHRRFNDEAAKRHIPFCKERVQGTPRNGSRNPTTGESMPSKTQQARDYAKNIPKPNTTRPKAGQSSTRPKTPHTTTASSNPPTGTASEPTTPRMPHTTPRERSTGRASESSGGAEQPRSARGDGDRGVRGRTGRSYMDKPFNFTASSGLNPQASSTSNHGNTSSKPPTGNHSNIGASGVSGKNVRFNVPGSGTERSRNRPNSSSPELPRQRSRHSRSFDAGFPSTTAGGATEGCASCQKTYGPNVASFSCSCGLKTAQL